MAAVEKYRILEELGAGGMGKVFKGHLIGQEGFQRPLVLKQMLSTADPGHLKLFVDEARRYAVLDHENIGRIFDFERVDGNLCIILEYIDGWSVVDFLERHRTLERLPSVDLAVFIVSRVCRALQYVFERSAIVHRDVSPSNIMITREGTVKLIDFGIATSSGNRERSLTGKPSYMAPEMITELRADNRSDLFSLGAVLFELLTLERLFKGATTSEVLAQVVGGQHPSPRKFNPGIADDVMAILRRALQRDPAKRFATAGEMGEACEHHLYDKGYGPTNLTLKQYLHALFPKAEDGEPSLEELPVFPVIEPTLIPIGDGMDIKTLISAPPTGAKGVRAKRPAAPAPAADKTVAPEDLPPGGTLPPAAERARKRATRRQAE